MFSNRRSLSNIFAGIGWMAFDFFVANDKVVTAKNDLFWIELMFKNECTSRPLFIIYLCEWNGNWIAVGLAWLRNVCSRNNKIKGEEKGNRTVKKKLGISVVWQSCINSFLSMIYWLIVADCWQSLNLNMNIECALFSLFLLTLNTKIVYIFKTEKSDFITLQSHCIIINSASIKTNLLYQVSASHLSTSKMPL